MLRPDQTGVLHLKIDSSADRPKGGHTDRETERGVFDQTGVSHSVEGLTTRPAWPDRVNE